MTEARLELELNESERVRIVELITRTPGSPWTG
jgi:hypothetical protein